MTKIVLPTISSGYQSTEALNEAFNAVEVAINNTLSRDGSTPNQMEADLDMNGHTLLNVGSGSDLLTQSDMEAYVDARASGMLMLRSQAFTATAAQQIFTITEFTYEVGAGNLAVYVNGVRKFSPTDYTETGTSSITFVAGLNVSDKVQILNTEFIANISLAAHTHAWADISGAPSYATRWPTWDEVTGKPADFHPEVHNHTASAIVSGRIVDPVRGVHVQLFAPTASTVGELWFW